jgi:hypothetical protein
MGVSPSAYRQLSGQALEGVPSCLEKQVTRPVRNREARLGSATLA